MKLDKDYAVTTSNSVGESKEKLAALREKRRLREAASNVAATTGIPAGGSSLKSDSMKSTGEEESGVEIESLSQKDDQNDVKESGIKTSKVIRADFPSFGSFIIYYLRIIQASRMRRRPS